MGVYSLLYSGGHVAGTGMHIFISGNKSQGTNLGISLRHFNGDRPISRCHFLIRKLLQHYFAINISHF